MARRPTAILISGRGTNMASLIDGGQSPDYPAEIVLVVSNNPAAGGLQRARELGVATEVIDHKQFGSQGRSSRTPCTRSSRRPESRSSASPASCGSCRKPSSTAGATG